MELRVFTEPQEGASFEQQLAFAQAAERVGFGAFFRSDHLLRIRAGSPLPGPTDSWVTLGAIARETERIRLGTLVTSATFRLPGPLAVTVAQVDAMSGGRVELGLGTGWFEAEHGAYGVPFPPFGERFDRLEEQLEILTGLWATPDGGAFSYRGRHYSLADCPALPRPAQRPGPPLIVGGRGPRRTPALAARFAAELNVPFSSAAECGEQYGRVWRACEESGRDPGSIVLSAAVTIACGEDDGAVRRRIEATTKAEEELAVGGATGSPQEVVEQLGAYRDAGAQRIYMQLMDLDDVDQLELIASEVAPQLS
jgi:F420-dependent oxidoreductase-like protein